MGLMHPLLCLVRIHCFTSLIVTTQGYKSRRSSLCTPASSHTICLSLLTTFPTPAKTERQKNEEKGKRKKEGYCQVLGSVASHSLSCHGGTRLDSFQGQTGSPAKPHEPRVYDGDGAHSLPHARGPRVPCTRRRIRSAFCSIF
jgi:hypothetical protein